MKLNKVRRHIVVRVIRSILVTAGMLSVSFLTLVSFLNLQGYMNARPSADFVPPAYVRRLRISSIARYSEPGEMKFGIWCFASSRSGSNARRYCFVIGRLCRCNF